MSGMRHGLWLLVVVVVLGAAGLFHLSGRSGSPPLPDPRPFGGVTYFTAAETATLHEATERQLVRCMRERGYTYHAVPATDHARAAAASPYLLLQAARVDADGYGITGHALDRAARTPAESRNDTMLAALPEDQRQRWRDALTGTPDHTETIKLPDGTSVSYPTNGCMFEARVMLYGAGWEQRFYRFQGYGNLVIQRTTADQRYVRAVTAWAACMRDDGHHYTELDDARSEITSRLAAAGDTAEPDGASWRDVARLELDTARQDLRCQRRAQLHEAVAAAQRDAENAVLTGALRSELSGLRDARQEALRLASEAATWREAAHG